MMMGTTRGWSLSWFSAAARDDQTVGTSLQGTRERSEGEPEAALHRILQAIRTTSRTSPDRRKRVWRGPIDSATGVRETDLGEEMDTHEYSDSLKNS